MSDDNDSEEDLLNYNDSKPGRRKSGKRKAVSKQTSTLLDSSDDEFQKKDDKKKKADEDEDDDEIEFVGSSCKNYKHLLETKSKSKSSTNYSGSSSSSASTNGKMNAFDYDTDEDITFIDNSEENSDSVLNKAKQLLEETKSSRAERLKKSEATVEVDTNNGNNQMFKTRTVMTASERATQIKNATAEVFVLDDNYAYDEPDIVVPKAVAEEVKEDVNEIKFVTRLNESEAYRKKWIINATESFGKFRTKFAEFYSIKDKKKLRFEFDGDQIADTESPASLDMDDEGNIIDVKVDKSNFDRISKEATK